MKICFQFGQRSSPRKIHHMVLHGPLVLSLCLALHNLAEFSLETGIWGILSLLQTDFAAHPSFCNPTLGHQPQTLTILPLLCCNQVMFCRGERGCLSFLLGTGGQLRCPLLQGGHCKGTGWRCQELLKMGFCPWWYLNSNSCYISRNLDFKILLYSNV